MGQDDADDLAAQIWAAGRDLDDCGAIRYVPLAHWGYAGSVRESNTAAA